ncbi:MAG: serine/threonine protein kinase, partial [Planctomycetes bacterium]|nr:serine/threonine protein kinase [Planctomycetota bacterium]
MTDTEWSYASGVLAQPPEGSPGPEPAEAAPKQIGPFVVEAELGRGGMAQVLQVRYRGQPFALKLLLHEAPEVRLRLEREAKLVGSLEHPGIVTLHGAGAIEGRAFLLYALIPEARTLSSAWAELPVEERVELIAQIADAVGFAHSRGIVHRDLKPDNVLVDALGHPRVIDFGLARQAGMERLTQSGMQLGTQTYMAPEQFSLDPDLQRPAVDVWSLGVLLYEALTERLPFPAQGIKELRGKLEEARPPSPRAANPKVSRALEAVCFRALSYDQAQRQPDALVFASELRAAIVQGPDPARGAARSRGLAWAALAL